MCRSLPLLLVASTLLTGCLPVPADVIQKAISGKGGAKAAAPPPPPGVASPPAGVEIVSSPQAGTSPAVTPTSTAPATTPKSGRLWVVVKNLKVHTGFGLESEISADWEVVQGSPDPGAHYVLRVSDGESGSIIERYVDFDIQLSQRSGSVREGVRGPTFGIRGGIIAVVGKTGGLSRDEIEEVSGKCRVGGSSEATPPPTVAEAAGQAAQGMPIAIANPRHEGRGIGSPRGGWAVDYEVQGSVGPGVRYFWIVEGSGGAVEFDVTSDLAFPGRATKGTFSGSPIGPGPRGGQLKMYIQRRGFGGFREEGTIVSNTVTLN